jgi:hypothetical protein
LLARRLDPLQVIEMTEQATAVPDKPRWRWLVWVFAALGVTTAVALIWLVVMLNSGFRHREPAVVAAAKPGETFEVGSVDALPGTDLVSIEIRKAEPGYGSGSVKGGRDDLRNLLLLDRTTGESRRLLPDNSVRIGQVRFLPAEAQGGEVVDDYARFGRDRPVPKPAFYLIELIHEIDGKPSHALLVGNVGDSGQAVVMERIAGVERLWMIDARQLGLIVREGQTLYFRVVDMVDRKVLQSRKIEIG